MSYPDVEGTKLRIVSAAETLCERAGPEAVTMRAVADAAGLSTMAAYRHFASKAELVEAVAQKGFDRLADTLAAVPEDLPAFEQLTTGRLRYLDFALQHPDLYRLMFVMPHPRRAPFPGGAGESDLPPAFRQLFRSVSSCIAEGVFRPADPLSVSLMIWATEHGLIQLYRSGRFGADERVFRSRFDDLMDLLFHGLGSAPESATAGVSE